MRRLATLVLFALLFVGPVAAKDKRDPHSARFGDLAITVTALESADTLQTPPKPLPPPQPPPPPPPPHRGDRHYVAVFVTVKNTGKAAVCMSFRSTLKATYGLTYSDTGGDVFNRSPRAPKIWEMLPGEASSGSYVFSVKDGVLPLEIVLTPVRKTLHCGSSEPSWKETSLPQDLRFDLHDLPGPPQ